MSVYQFSLKDVHCAACVRAIDKALNRAGFDEHAINFADRTATVEADSQPEDIVNVIENAGYGADLIKDEEDYEKRAEEEKAEYRATLSKALISIGVGAVLMVLMLTDAVPSPDTPLGLGVGALFAAITLAILATCARPFYRGAWTSGIHGNFNMDTLIALGTGTAWIYSTVLLALLAVVPDRVPAAAHHLYYEASVMIIGFILLGRALEAKARGNTSNALKSLIKLQPHEAVKVVYDDDGHIVEEKNIAVKMLVPGDRVRIRPGEQVPVDGVVIEGKSHVDESMLTGEPVPAVRGEGDKLTGGTVNGSGSVLMEVGAVGRSTVLARIVSTVRKAQNAKPPLGLLADRIAGVFVPVVIGIAVVTFFAWLAIAGTQSWPYAIISAVAVLIIACPCALGLATPVSVMVGVGRAAKMGILIRNGDALQRACELTTIVFDKTGTLTEGKPKVVDQQIVEDQDHGELLRRLLAVESRAEHPLARALCDYVRAQGVTDDAHVEEFDTEAGAGVKAQVDGQTILVGSQTLLEDAGVETMSLVDTAKRWSGEGRSLIWVALSGQLAGLFAVADPLREDSIAALEQLKKRHLKLVMLSGDNERTAQAIGKQAGIDTVIAGVKPQQKQDEIKRLQSQGEVVAMVGDGVNDAPALAQADIGYAMGGGTDVAISSADVTLMQNSLAVLADAILLSRATVTSIKQNLFAAFIYNVCAIPIAAGVFFSITGWLLNPAIAGAAMAMSSLTVVTNASRLATKKL